MLRFLLHLSICAHCTVTIYWVHSGADASTSQRCAVSLGSDYGGLMQSDSVQIELHSRSNSLY